MLTPIEIQGISFKNGRGYKKADVDSFMKALYHDYEIMYKENKDLKDKVSTLSDGVQYYRNLEKTLQKALVLAEKTSEETKNAAQKQADVILENARADARNIMFEARQDYNKVESKTQELLQQFELCKSQFKQIVTAQLDLLSSSSFDVKVKDRTWEEPVTLNVEKELEVDKTEVKATDEEERQAEKLANEVKMEKEAAVTLEDVKSQDSGIDIKEIEKSLNKVNESLSKRVEQEETKESEEDDKTDLEVKMLQKLLNEIKKNDDIEDNTKDEEFEFINTDTEE